MFRKVNTLKKQLSFPQNMILTLRKYLNFYNDNILHNGFLTAVASSALGAKQITFTVM